MAEELRTQANRAAHLAIRASGEQQFKRTQDRLAEDTRNRATITEQKEVLQRQTASLANEVSRLKQNQEGVASTRSSGEWNRQAEATRSKAAEIAEGLEFGSSVYFEAQSVIDQLEKMADVMTDLGTTARKGSRASPQEQAAVQNHVVDWAGSYSSVSPAAGLAAGAVSLVAPPVQKLGISLVEENGRKIDALLGHLTEPSGASSTSSDSIPAYRPPPAWLATPPRDISPSNIGMVADQFGPAAGSRFDPPSGYAGSRFDSPTPAPPGSRFDEVPSQSAPAAEAKSPSWIDRLGHWRNGEESDNKPKRTTHAAPAAVKDQFSKKGSRFD